MIVEPINLADGVGHPHQLRNGIGQGVELEFAGLQRCFRTLALGDLFRSDIDGDDFAARAAQRVPIGDPKPLVGLIGTLAGNFDARDRFAALHDRAHDIFDRARQSRYAIPNRSSQMILNGDAADLREALIDLQVAAVG